MCNVAATYIETSAADRVTLQSASESALPTSGRNTFFDFSGGEVLDVLDVATTSEYVQRLQERPTQWILSVDFTKNHPTDLEGAVMGTHMILEYFHAPTYFVVTANASSAAAGFTAVSGWAASVVPMPALMKVHLSSQSKVSPI